MGRARLVGRLGMVLSLGFLCFFSSSIFVWFSNMKYLVTSWCVRKGAIGWFFFFWLLVKKHSFGLGSVGRVLWLSWVLGRALFLKFPPRNDHTFRMWKWMHVWSEVIQNLGTLFFWRYPISRFVLLFSNFHCWQNCRVTKKPYQWSRLLQTHPTKSTRWWFQFKKRNLGKISNLTHNDFRWVCSTTDQYGSIFITKNLKDTFVAKQSTWNWSRTWDSMGYWPPLRIWYFPTPVVLIATSQEMNWWIRKGGCSWWLGEDFSKWSAHINNMYISTYILYIVYYQRKFRLRNFRYTNNISVKLSQVEQVK